MTKLPLGAKPILAVRNAGKRPTDLVLISNIGAIPGDNPVVQVEDGAEYDWRWIMGLQFCFFGSINVSMFEHLENICKMLKGKLPPKMMIWDESGKAGMDTWYLPVAETIHLPQSQWEWEFSFIDWMPLQNKEFAV